jgi:hypothetical protein
MRPQLRMWDAHTAKPETLTTSRRSRRSLLPRTATRRDVA